VERRHDQHIGRAGEAAERILLHHLHVERHIGVHLAIILEIHAALVEDADGLLHPLGTFAGRVAEGGVGKHRHPRLVAQAPGDTGGFLGDIGQFFGLGMS
jgi:hypothetical protein